MKETMPEKDIIPHDLSREKIVDLAIQKIDDYCFGVEKIKLPRQKIELKHEIMRLMKQGAGFSEEVVDYIVSKIEDDDYLTEIIQKKWPAESDSLEYFNGFDKESFDEDGVILNDLLMYLKGKLIDMLNLTAAKNLPQGFKRVLQHCLEKNKIFSEINYKDLHSGDSHDNTFKENFEIISEDDQQRPLFSNYDEIIPETLFGVRRNLSNYKDSEVKEILDSLIETVEKGKVTQSLVRHYSLFFSETKPNYCAGRLLEILKNNLNPETKKLSSRLLYSIELGRVNVSYEGVKYLERMYDLEEYNNPNNFVQRLTVEGNIGVFNESRELAGYFNLGDLSSDEERVKAKVFEFTYETLFLSKAEETQEEKQEREKILEEFKRNYFKFYDNRFFNETEVKFNNLSFKEQGWFMHYAKHSDKKEKDRALSFVKKYREDGFKTFLSLEYGRELGDKILNIGEKLENNGANLIFAKFNSIIGLTGNIEQKLTALLSDKDQKKIDKNKISEQLLRKAKDLLVQFSEQLDKGEKVDYQDAVRSLDKISEEIILFASIFKTASQERPISFQEISETKLESKNSGDLTEAEKQEMICIFRDNRQHYPPELLKESMGEFMKAINSADKEFHFLTHQDKLVSFLRFDKLKNGNLYAGSLNVRPEIKGSAIGSATLKAVLDRTAKNYEIEAVVYAQNPMTKHYINDFNFHITGIDLDYKKTGQPFFQLLRSDNMSNSFLGPKMSDAEVIKKAEQPPSNEIYKILTLDLNDALEITRVQQILQTERLIITRFLPIKNQKKVYLVLEKFEQPSAAKAA